MKEICEVDGENIGPEGEKLIEDWRKLYNEQIHNLFLSSDIIMAFNQEARDGQEV